MPKAAKGMGRANVVATRLSDAERDLLGGIMHRAEVGQADYVRQAILEKMERDVEVS